MPAPCFLALRDGRRLAWYEYGDPRGVPCIYTPGTPASGLVGMIYDGAARRVGVRWISVDKPGYGHSGFQPRRRLLDWPRDIAALAEHLGLARFAVAGESGGGPHVLALAYAMPQRITAALFIAGMGPATEGWVRDGMNPLNRRLFWMAQHAPCLLRPAMAGLARTLSHPQRREEFLRRHFAAAPAADRAWTTRHPQLMRLQIDAMLDAIRDGGRAAAQEMRIVVGDWGFRLADVVVPVLLWHGTEDANVPVAVARRVASGLPNCKARIVAGEGHAVSLGYADEIVGSVLRHASSERGAA